MLSDGRLATGGFWCRRHVMGPRPDIMCGGDWGIHWRDWSVATLTSFGLGLLRTVYSDYLDAFFSTLELRNWFDPRMYWPSVSTVCVPLIPPGFSAGVTGWNMKCLSVQYLTILTELCTGRAATRFCPRTEHRVIPKGRTRPL